MARVKRFAAESGPELLRIGLREIVGVVEVIQQR